MDNQFQQSSNFSTSETNLPNSTIVLVLGIASLIACCLNGIPSLICSIIALVLAKKDMALIAENPNGYTTSSVKNLKAGKVCAIIGLSLSIVILLATIILIAVIGFDGISNLQESLKNYK